MWKEEVFAQFAEQEDTLGRIFDWVYEGQIFDDVFNFINASIIGDNKVKN